ncbi:methyltransferase [Candidatus Nanopelagicus hibericus]|uniref:Methyltransferase n=1 Tax=Candidatus Nanopelagicus hibericus TaxID=1884915 RepID=A0A249KAM9_9ACTN|nr:methyltransferase [Candidatus Nanopelagicus hibericus]
MLSIEVVFSRMHSLYRNLGLQILGGYSNYLVQPTNGAQFNFVADDTFLKSTSGGIANDEATFLYGICRFLQPKKILVIGNSYGVSTLFLSLVNLESDLVALDKFRVNGNAVTRELLKDMHHKTVIEGSTPEDLIAIIDRYLGGAVDFCLIDAVHTDEVQTAEFKILQRYMSAKSVIVFHDVISTDLMKSFNQLRDLDNTFDFKLATKTSSGLGLAIKGDLEPEFESYLAYFTQNLDTVSRFSLAIDTLNLSRYFPAESIKAFKIPPHPQT